jgi:hypothetical protein
MLRDHRVIPSHEHAAYIGHDSSNRSFPSEIRQRDLSTSGGESYAIAFFE